MQIDTDRFGVSGSLDGLPALGLWNSTTAVMQKTRWPNSTVRHSCGAAVWHGTVSCWSCTAEARHLLGRTPAVEVSGARPL